MSKSKKYRKDLDVKSEEVVNMNRRMMGHEKSLNDPIKSGETDEWQDWLAGRKIRSRISYVSKTRI